ncbi:DNA cytosine methyltransferase [Candidatus Sumerlaeota bacterium]|nr:DNA cytosine methyltransferase [Candidatus Sumerlaeota bacterium]
MSDAATSRHRVRHDRPIGIDLFAGAGGLSLGFEQAGFDVVAAVELDPIHAATHKFNFPDCAVIARSIVGLTGAEIRRMSGLQDREVDVVFGGPPCQGFSLIGQRALEDPRNSLVREFVRVVCELDAKHFVFENVKGLTVGKQKRFLDELIGDFENRGYRVRLPWQVLNASSFGTPQDRKRLFLLGARKDLGVPDYPEPTTCPRPDPDDLFGLERTPTCKDALDDLPEAEEFEELISFDSVPASDWGQPSSYARDLRCLDPESWRFGYERRWDPRILTSSLRTRHSAISRKRFLRTGEGQVEPISRFYKLPAEGISNTLRAGTDSARGAFTSPRPIHYRSPRCVTVREMARLHGYPDWFRFHATKWHGARQVGNSVPPLLGRAIAGAIAEALGVQPRSPSRVVRLGDPALLQMDMGSASMYWGVRTPIARRDRKSGARKRRQSEVEAQATTP